MNPFSRIPILRYQSTDLHDQWPKGHDYHYTQCIVNMLLSRLADGYRLAQCPQSPTNQLHAGYSHQHSGLSYHICHTVFSRKIFQDICEQKTQAKNSLSKSGPDRHTGGVLSRSRGNRSGLSMWQTNRKSLQQNTSVSNRILLFLFQYNSIKSYFQFGNTMKVLSIIIKSNKMSEIRALTKPSVSCWLPKRLSLHVLSSGIYFLCLVLQNTDKVECV